jgi:hypothetical protein
MRFHTDPHTWRVKRSETMIRALVLANFLVLILVSCTKGDKVPAYVQVDNIQVSTDPVTQGSGSHRITEVWAFENDRALGVWEVPAEIPVLATGTNSVKMIAGNRIQYPFYATWSGTADLVPEGSTSIAPVFTYFDGLDFWIEAFEDPGYKFTVASQSDTTLLTITDPQFVFEGNASGAFFLDQQHPYFQCFTQEEFTTNGTGPVFLELDYSCDVRFLIGVYYTVSGTVVKEPFLFIAPNSSPGNQLWNKIYVDLSAQFNYGGVTNKEFYIEAQLDLSTPSGSVYLDNVKLIKN